MKWTAAAVVIASAAVACNRETSAPRQAQTTFQMAKAPCDYDLSDVPNLQIKAAPRPSFRAQVRLEPQDTVSRSMHEVTQLQMHRPDLDGSGVTISFMERFPIWPDHPQFLRSDGTSRVTLATMVKGSGNHATQVTGIAASAGFASKEPINTHPATFSDIYGMVSYGEASRGIAPAVNVLSYVAADCLFDDAMARANVSSYSLTKPSGWEVIDGEQTWMGPDVEDVPEDPHFGRYDRNPARLDAALFSHPEHLAIAAAGNDRGDGPFGSAPHQHYMAGPHMDQHMRDGGDTGLDTVNSWCVAKNALCVGAIADRRQNKPIEVTPISNFGPTDDGRIKPDVVANGTSVFTTDLQGNPYGPYSFTTGTSSATPNVAGVAALVAQELRNRSMAVSGAIIKALLIHTAEPSSANGPDPMTGWGMVRAAHAIDALAKSGFVGTVPVAPQVPHTKCFASVANQTPRVTVVWTDPAGPERTGTDDPTPVLVNDIDATLEPQGGPRQLPWVLKGTKALRGENHVDNVEVIDPVGTQHALWRLTLTATRLGQGTSQEVALVVTGLKPATGC
jgi:hypothetical protein